MWIRPRSLGWFEMVFVASSIQTFPLIFAFAVAILQGSLRFDDAPVYDDAARND